MSCWSFGASLACAMFGILSLWRSFRIVHWCCLCMFSHLDSEQFCFRGFSFFWVLCSQLQGPGSSWCAFSRCAFLPVVAQFPSLTWSAHISKVATRVWFVDCLFFLVHLLESETCPSSGVASEHSWEMRTHQPQKRNNKWGCNSRCFLVSHFRCIDFWMSGNSK